MPPRKKPVASRSARKPKPKARRSFTSALWWVVLLLLFAGGSYFAWQHRFFIKSYLKSLSERPRTNAPEVPRLEQARDFEVLQRHAEKVAGIDVSQYQGRIDWSRVQTIGEAHPIGFVVVRSTAGRNKVDSRFRENWRALEDKEFIRGAYHYYRPNESSLEQAELFIRTVQLRPGDFPPILDIEELPRVQSMENLRMGLQRWLDRVEAHYGVQPIIYTGESYYKDYIKAHFPNYRFWIANYNWRVQEPKPDWMMWQFTDKGVVPGIKGPVDVNLFHGTPRMLGYLVGKVD